MDIMDLRHQSSAMYVIKLGEKTHTGGLQRKEETPYQPLTQWTSSNRKQPTNYSSQSVETSSKKLQRYTCLQETESN